MIIMEEIEQGTEAWFAEKAGKPSASDFSKIITTSGAQSKQRKDYLYQLAGESIIGKAVGGYTNANMEEGIKREDEARALFELHSGLKIKTVGMCYLNEGKSVLCSPDGLVVGESLGAGIEIKNPLLKTHIKYLLAEKIPTDYICQVQGSLAVTGYSYWYFVSYYPGVPPLILKIERDEYLISRILEELDIFVLELAATIVRLRELGALGVYDG